MKLECNLLKHDKFWLAESPLLDLMSQGRTKKEAVDMLKDAIMTLANVPSRSIKINPIKFFAGDCFYFDAKPTPELIGLILRRQRNKSGLSLADVKEKIQASSRNSYARYEKGNVDISMSKFSELFAVVAGRELILK